MPAHMPPIPSGYVRPRRQTVPFGEFAGPVRFVVEGLMVVTVQSGSLFRKLARDIAQQRERARMMSELSVLPDHTLKDVGIERSGIRAAVMDIERGVDPRGR